MNLRKELHDTNVKAAMVSSLLFFILAFPDLFQAVDTLMRKILGGKMYNMHLIVLTIHSVLFGVLFYYINQFLQKPVLVEANSSDHRSCEDKSVEENMNILKQTTCREEYNTCIYDERCKSLAEEHMCNTPSPGNASDSFKFNNLVECVRLMEEEKRLSAF